MTATVPFATGTRPYEVDDAHFDEAFTPEAKPRPHYRELMAGLEGRDLPALVRSVAADLHSRGVRFRSVSGDQPFVVDPVPRLLTADEWRELSAGLGQRVRALNAFLSDAYGSRRIVEAGRVPAELIDESVHFEPDMVGVEVPAGVYAGVAGLDVVRDHEGRFLVLEDNLRTPSGLAYMAAARNALIERLPVPAPEGLGALGVAVDMLGDALRAAAPDGVDDPFVVLLTDGPVNSAWYEHEWLARRLGIPIVTLGDLEVRGGRLLARSAESARPVDVVYRRTDEDRLTDESGRPTAVAMALLQPLRAGRIGCVNAFGTGIADDKLAHAYVEDMIRFYLGEEPLLPSVPTYDPTSPAIRERVLERLEDLVIKPRVGHGGHGIVICPQAGPSELEQVRNLVRTAPEQVIAQVTVRLSRHPTVVDDHLEPRHVDLRPFVLSAGDHADVVPGGLTRVALSEGSLVVNSSQDGGGKDTWVLP